MKKLLLCLMTLLSVQFTFAQHALTYQSYTKGVVNGDTTTVIVVESSRCLKISTQEKRISNPIPGYAQSTTYVDYAQDSVYTLVEFADGKYFQSSGEDNGHHFRTVEGSVISEDEPDADTEEDTAEDCNEEQVFRNVVESGYNVRCDGEHCNGKQCVYHKFLPESFVGQDYEGKVNSQDKQTEVTSGQI